MAMRSSSSPRRIYVRSGNPLVCFGGVYFGPTAKAKVSAIDPAHEVTIEMLEKAGRTRRIAVTQTVGPNTVTENWSEKHLTFEKRAPKAAPEATEE